MNIFSKQNKKIRFLTSSVILCLLTANSPLEQLGLSKPPSCGSQYAPPFASAADAGPRQCPPPVARQYQRRHGGVGYDVLDVESNACFVPDSTFMLLDRIVDEATARMASGAPPGESARDRALRASRITGQILEDMGFGLYIPTETLADALQNRAESGAAPRHIFDCDTGALIMLTVAENLGMPAYLIEITLPSGSGHNYVRWQIAENEWLDWDTNGRGPCDTPANLPAFEGRNMTRDETIAYVLTIRAALWKRQQAYQRAATDYESAIAMAPDRPMPMNNFAWMVSTREFPGRQAFRARALAAAQQAVHLQRTPGFLDTLGCALALNGDFAAAVAIQREALSGDPGNADYQRRLALFEASTPRDCTGQT